MAKDISMARHIKIVDFINFVTEEIQTAAIVFTTKTVINTTTKHRQIIVFQTVLQNVGNAYDATIGILTSPVNGNFIFSVQVCVHTLYCR